MRVADALIVAWRTNDPQAWKLAKRMAEVEIGRFAVSLVIGLQNARNEEHEAPTLRPDELEHRNGKPADLSARYALARIRNG